MAARKAVTMVSGLSLVERPEVRSRLRLEKTLCTRGVQLSWVKWWPEAESNCRHGDFQSPALPTELSGHSGLFSDIERNCCIQGAPLNPLALVQSRASDDRWRNPVQRLRPSKSLTRTPTASRANIERFATSILLSTSGVKKMNHFTADHGHPDFGAVNGVGVNAEEIIGQ